jgi:CheY-like chemotaxis protein
MKHSEGAAILDTESGLAERERPLVLVVEDDDDLRGLVADLLRDEEFTVTEAPNGQAALDYLLAAPTPPSLILLDLNMPLMSGREMLGRLRGHARLAAIPVVIVTSEPPDKGAADEGAVARLQKPYAAGHLIKLVREHTALARPNDADDAGPGHSRDMHLPRLVD